MYLNTLNIQQYQIEVNQHYKCNLCVNSELLNYIQITTTSATNTNYKPLSLLRKITTQDTIIKYKAVHLPKTSPLSCQKLKLRTCLTVSHEINTVKPIVKNNCSDKVQKPQNWNQFLSESSELDFEQSNLTLVISQFNSLDNDFLPLVNMIRQTINGLEFKNQKLDELLYLSTSHEATMDLLIASQAQLYLNILE
ncbi:Hypothetical_protein [Hexamita inflata]|uniref:Hypothetical_protein n=1 Tax=Hexamita inflata TaxID=28002 RepID=A0AA86NG88_9EUKA|nr:Hypothetical protein HINF_LOCUS6712 [Hexamita inflata]